MSGWLRTIAAVGAAAMVSMGPASAAQDLGVYQTTDRKMDFHLQTCGSGDRELCVTLTAARGTAATWQVTPYIGKLVINRAKPTGSNAWKGKMQFSDYAVSGKMILTPGQSFVVSGCAMIVICEDFNLIAAQ
jgi:hypothetical protein